MSAGRRRGPWLSGLVLAVLGAVWMIGQVLGGVVSMAGDALTAVLPPASVPSAPLVEVSPGPGG